ncbi:MAG: hypothetical protein HWD84_04435 [Flavobacteriaceae bacterium]|jgi:hypothetical protein|nr:hypothetical protein [Flavobacteriaceae bacterium]NVJ72708.1 hypothetical protein [Flavobacteriaceae bacterium]
MKTLIKSVLFVYIILLTSCNKTDTNNSFALSDDQLLIENKLGLSSINQNNNKSDVDSNFIEFDKYIDRGSKEIYTIYRNYLNLNEYIVKKEINNQTKKLLRINSILDKDLNGSLQIKNLLTMTEIEINYLDGRPITDKYSMSNRLNICQANANETISECVERETDEFCSDLVSTLAYYTNPSIHVLIIILCSCEITE